MPIPSVITDLSATAASNSPVGTDSPNVLDDHQRAAGAFIRQLYDVVCGGGGGALSLSFGTAAINFCAGQFYKDASGNFGFGTGSPTTRVHIAGSADVLRVSNGARNCYVALDTGGFSLLSGASQTGTGLYADAAGDTLRLWAASTERMRVKPTGQIRFVPLAAAPSGAEAGDVYFNSTTGKHYGYDGATWQALY